MFSCVSLGREKTLVCLNKADLPRVNNFKSILLRKVENV